MTKDSVVASFKKRRGEVAEPYAAPDTTPRPGVYPKEGRAALSVSNASYAAAKEIESHGRPEAGVSA